MPLSLSDVIDDSKEPALEEENEIDDDNEDNDQDELESEEVEKPQSELKRTEASEDEPVRDAADPSPSGSGSYRGKGNRALDDILDEEEISDKPSETKTERPLEDPSPSAKSNAVASSSKAPSPRLERETISKAKSSDSEDDSSSEDETSDEEAAREAKKKKSRARALKAESTARRATEAKSLADRPDDKYLDQLSDERLSKQDIAKLKWWSFLIVLDKSDRSTWKLPYRDGLGRLNRPLLSHARQILSDERRANEMELILSREVLDQARRSFRLAWPGQPVKLVRAIDAPVSSVVEPVQSFDSVIEQSKKRLEGMGLTKESSILPEAKPKPQVVEVESDAAPTLLMKIRQRQQAATLVNRPGMTVPKTAIATAARYARPLAPTMALPRDTKKLELLAAARRQHAESRQRKNKVDREVNAEIDQGNQRASSATVVTEAEEETQQKEKRGDEEDSEEADEDWEPEDGNDDDEDDDEEGSGSDEEDDEEEGEEKVPTQPLVDEDELGGGDDEKRTMNRDSRQDTSTSPPSVLNVADEKTQVIDAEGDVTVVATTEQDDLSFADPLDDGGDVANPPMESTSQSISLGKEKKGRAENYRAMLEAEALKVAKQGRSRFLESEAEEEDEENQVGNYGLSVKEKVIGMASDDDDDDDERENAEGNLMPTEEDLKGIVDTNSDDEGEDENVRQAFLQEDDKRDELLLKKLEYDLKNGTLIERRRKLNASGVQRALDDDDFDSDGDEERRQAVEARFKRELQERLNDVRASKREKHLGEREEDILAEDEQGTKFMEMAFKMKRSQSLMGGVAAVGGAGIGRRTPGIPAASSSSSSSSAAIASMGMNEEEMDEDTRTLRECLARSASQPAFECASSSASQSGLEMLFPTSSLPAAPLPTSVANAGSQQLRRSSTLLGVSSRSTVASMTNSFVYTKKVVTLTSSSSLPQATAADANHSTTTTTTNNSQQQSASSSSSQAPGQLKRSAPGGRTIPMLKSAKKRRVELQPVPVHNLASRSLLAPVRLQSTAMSGRRD